MFIEKLYAGNKLSYEDVTNMVSMFFKVNKVECEKHRISKFVMFMVNYNDHPILQKFVSLEEVVYNIIMPDIEREIEMMKIYDKNNQLITIRYNQNRFNELQNN